MLHRNFAVDLLAVPPRHSVVIAALTSLLVHAGMVALLLWAAGDRDQDADEPELVVDMDLDVAPEAPAGFDPQEPAPAQAGEAPAEEEAGGSAEPGSAGKSAEITLEPAPDLEAAARAEQERIERERAEQEQAAKEQAEKEQAEKERLAKEQAEKERLAKERAEKERLAKERAEKERAEKEQALAAAEANDEATADAGPQDSPAVTAGQTMHDAGAPGSGALSDEVAAAVVPDAQAPSEGATSAFGASGADGRLQDATTSATTLAARSEAAAATPGPEGRTEGPIASTTPADRRAVTPADPRAVTPADRRPVASPGSPGSPSNRIGSPGSPSNRVGSPGSPSNRIGSPGSPSNRIASPGGSPGGHGAASSDAKPAKVPPGAAADLRAYSPDGDKLAVLLRYDRLRGTPWAALADAIIAPMPDYRSIVGDRKLELADLFQSVLISTRNPANVTATHMVARTHLGSAEVRRFLDHSLQRVVWQPVRGGALGQREPSEVKHARDRRVYLMPFPGLVVLTAPKHLGVLTQRPTTARDLDGARAIEAELPPWLARARTVENEAGVDSNVIAVVTVGGLRRAEIPIPELGLLPTPERFSLALEMAKVGFYVRGTLAFATPERAEQFETRLIQAKERMLSSRLTQLMLRNLHAYHALKGLTLRRRGQLVTYATSISNPDARAAMKLAAEWARRYFEVPADVEADTAPGVQGPGTPRPGIEQPGQQPATTAPGARPTGVQVKPPVSAPPGRSVRPGHSQGSGTVGGPAGR